MSYGKILITAMIFTARQGYYDAIIYTYIYIYILKRTTCRNMYVRYSTVAGGRNINVILFDIRCPEL